MSSEVELVPGVWQRNVTGLEQRGLQQSYMSVTGHNSTLNQSLGGVWTLAFSSCIGQPNHHWIWVFLHRVWSSESGGVQRSNVALIEVSHRFRFKARVLEYSLELELTRLLGCEQELSRQWFLSQYLRLMIHAWMEILYMEKGHSYESGVMEMWRVHCIHELRNRRLALQSQT